VLLRLRCLRSQGLRGLAGLGFRGAGAILAAMPSPHDQRAQAVYAKARELNEAMAAAVQVGLRCEALALPVLGEEALTEIRVTVTPPAVREVRSA
jgi:hypothetical protein